MIIQICAGSGHAKEWGRGWVVSHSSLIYYYSQQPGGSGYFPVLQIKKLNSEDSQAPEYQGTGKSAVLRISLG